MLAGSLSHPADERAEGRLQALLARRHADALIVLRKWLREALRADADTTAPQIRFRTGMTE